MQYTILVTGPIYGTQNSISSFLFVKSLIKKKHIVRSIFFYADGVYNANIMSSPNYNEIDLLKFWKKISIENNIILKLCIGSSIKRGLIIKNLVKKKGILTRNVDENFKSMGLLELSKDIILSDRVVQF
ncbi:sulfurtransferase complex subunit TusD [Buchnera aphidicola (Chaitoregma tattakana)]|uniref:sulfurtransferase complex subunit TusD n=1 Tax=Buchnera aphidicola TaxID=9 RepID=UPI0031B82196